ncbi:N-acetyltransferase [Acidocella aquatica]|uniref:N-acetyltransferase n=1 Tax=Acidocella aquatica TaxID=1922313 RepID=A0ABQ6AC66_9PROT|nr:N-acetyltransferase [Acidocella aquatica]
MDRDLPLGPQVDPWPRPLPARTPISGAYVALEPLHRRHAGELFEAMRGAEASFTYMSYGPFASQDELGKWIAASAAQHDPMFWAVRPVATGMASGWLALMDIEPAHAAIELGNIWFSPRLARTRAATEAMFLLLRRAADELGYRRLVWKCNAHNAASISAAHRLGFMPEGLLRAHKVVKGRQRDTAMFSITAPEWPSRRDAMLAWLAAENFAPDGTAKQGLAALRG